MTHNCEKEEIFQEFTIERNLTKSSTKVYRNVLNTYCNYHQLTLTQLLKEADDEEEQRIRLKNRKILQRLKNYRTHQLQAGLNPNTIIDYLTKIKGFYKHYLIEIPPLPPLKHTKKQVMIEEIPSKKDIKELLQHTNNLKYRAMIYFMAASGTARQELCNLTLQDFLDATYEYHHETDIKTALQKLFKEKNIIPLFKMTRQKTGYKYYTCITPEATDHLLRYLKTKFLHNLQPEDPLFDTTPSALTMFMQRLNRMAGFPMVNGKAYLHPHNIRRYHATTINERDLGDILQGRRPSRIREAYFKQDPNKIKEEYTAHLADLTLEPTRVVTIEDKEVTKLKKELQKEQQNNKELQADVDDLKSEVKMFGKMLTEILSKQN